MINLNQLPNQQRDEKCEIFLRRHWLEILKIVGITLGLLILLAVLAMILRQILPASSPIMLAIFTTLISGYLFIVGIIFMNQFTDYYLDTWIVTTERIINIEQIGLFNRVISELYLNQIQDVTSETKGVLGTFLTYGDVYIQSAGTRQRFNFKDIDNPDEVKEQILQLVQTNKRRRGDASLPTSMSDALTEEENSDSMSA